MGSDEKSFHIPTLEIETETILPRAEARNLLLNPLKHHCFSLSHFQYIL